MPNHKQLKVIGGFALLTCLLLDWFLPVHWGVYGILIVSMLGMIAYGSATIQSQFFVKTICSGSGDQPNVALTFDDGPDVHITPKVLEVLKKHQVQATFFCIGHKMESQKELVRQIDAEGHLIANHSYSHSYYFDLFPYKKVLEELQQTNQNLAAITGKKTQLFRPPYGVTNPAIARAIGQTKMKVIGWNVRSLDTIIKDKAKLMNRLKNKIKPGSIILFHDTQQFLPELLNDFLAYLKQQNYSIVRLDKLIGIEAYSKETNL